MSLFWFLVTIILLLSISIKPPSECTQVPCGPFPPTVAEEMNPLHQPELVECINTLTKMPGPDKWKILCAEIE